MAAHGEPPPPELDIGLNCQAWQTLPDAGGYLEQDYALMKRMNTALNIYRVVQKWNRLEGKAIHSLTDHERKVLGALRDMGIMFQ